MAHQLQKVRRFSQAFRWKNITYSASRHEKHKLVSLHFQQPVKSLLMTRTFVKDVVIPPEPFPRQKLPVCLFIHGGSWQRGDKESLFNHNILDRFAELGIVGISMNYRLSPEVLEVNIASNNTQILNGSLLE